MQNDLRKILQDLSVISEAFNRLIGEVKFFIVRAEAQNPQSPESDGGTPADDFTPTEETLKGNTFLAVKEEFMPKIKNIYVYRRKDGYYSATVAVRGARKTFVSKHKTVATKKAREHLASILKITPAPITDLNGLAEYYLANVKKPFVSEAYYATLKGAFLKNIKPFFEKQRVSDILPVTLQRYFNELCARSTRVAEDVKTILTQVFDYAVGNKLITANPMRAVIVEQHSRQNGKALTREQLVLFKQKILTRTVYRVPLLILLYTGVRRSELLSLDFDFEGGFVTVKNSKLKRHQKKNPQAIYRKVPILKALYDIRADIERGEWRKVCLDELHKAYVDIMGEGRLNYLRHTFQTYCRLFASKEMVNLWTGHAIGEDMTDKVYNHIPPEEQLKVANIICY